MTPEAELELLAVTFRERGFHVEYPSVHGSILVASNPEEANGIRVFKRSVHISRRNSLWFTVVGGIESGERASEKEIERFVLCLMEGSDHDYRKECARRQAIVAASA